MPSEVDICNLALAHIGDSATVASISPPEGSAQASHCARFYPIARDALLEQSSWAFSTVRISLAQVNNLWPMWKYAYQAPSDMVNSLAILPPDASDDYSASDAPMNTIYNVVSTSRAIYEPQPYANEFDNVSGIGVILTNQANAVLRYSKIVTDASLFSPTFTSTLSYLLASYLAGPIIKGDAGLAVSKQMRALAQVELSIARESDAQQGMIRATQSVPWLVVR